MEAVLLQSAGKPQNLSVCYDLDEVWYVVFLTEGPFSSDRLLGMDQLHPHVRK